MAPIGLSPTELTEVDKALERVKTTVGASDVQSLERLHRAYLQVVALLEHKDITVKRLQRIVFGPSSEKTSSLVPTQPPTDVPVAVAEPPTVDGAANADNDRADDHPPDSAHARDSKGDKRRRPGHGRRGADQYPGARRTEVPLSEELKAGKPCPECFTGKLYELDPAKILRIFGASPLTALVWALERLRCSSCGEVFTAAAPQEAIGPKYDATAVAMMLVLRYGFGMPWNRSAKLQQSVGVPVPAGTQCDLTKAAAPNAKPAFDELVRQAAQSPRFYNDDTLMRVLSLMGKRDRAGAEHDSRVSDPERTGIFTTAVVADGGEHCIVLYRTGRRHAGENLAEVLKERQPSLPLPLQMCDALSRNLPKSFQTIVCNCLAHGRREFADVASRFPDQCLEVLTLLGAVYKNDDIAKQRNMSAAERLQWHQEQSGPVMARLKKWLHTQFRDRLVEPNSPLGHAITYVRNHWRKLTMFLKVPGAPLDNSLCERTLKRAIIHRKNSLFYKTLAGAEVGDIFMSLIHTAELAGEDPWRYLVALLEHPEQVAAHPADWLPWSYRRTLEAITENKAA